MDRTLHPITAILRKRLCLLLPLLWVLSQHGAWLHELSHAAYAAAAHQVSVQQSGHLPEQGVCATCQSFGQLGTALSTALTVMAAPHSAHRPYTDSRYPSPSAQLAAPRNRGPPKLA